VRSNYSLATVFLFLLIMGLIRLVDMCRLKTDVIGMRDVGSAAIAGRRQPVVIA
jgi:hypothetical protein